MVAKLTQRELKQGKKQRKKGKWQEGIENFLAEIDPYG